MTNPKKQSTEAAVRAIRRRTRRKFSPEEKIRIVLRKEGAAQPRESTGTPGGIRTPDPCISSTLPFLVYWAWNGVRERVADPTQRQCPRT